MGVRGCDIPRERDPGHFEIQGEKTGIHGQNSKCRRNHPKVLCILASVSRHWDRPTVKQDVFSFCSMWKLQGVARTASQPPLRAERIHEGGGPRAFVSLKIHGKILGVNVVKSKVWRPEWVEERRREGNIDREGHKK